MYWQARVVKIVGKGIAVGASGLILVACTSSPNLPRVRHDAPEIVTNNCYVNDKGESMPCVAPALRVGEKAWIKEYSGTYNFTRADRGSCEEMIDLRAEHMRNGQPADDQIRISGRQAIEVTVLDYSGANALESACQDMVRVKLTSGDQAWVYHFNLAHSPPVAPPSPVTSRSSVPKVFPALRFNSSGRLPTSLQGFRLGMDFSEAPKLSPRFKNFGAEVAASLNEKAKAG